MKHFLSKEKSLNLKILTNKDIWDFVVVCYINKLDDSVLKIYESSDNYFYCGFNHIDKHIQFKIKLKHNLVGLWGSNESEHFYDIEAWYNNMGRISVTISESLLLHYIKPIIRECKLNSIGI